MRLLNYDKTIIENQYHVVDNHFSSQISHKHKLNPTMHYKAQEGHWLASALTSIMQYKRCKASCSNMVPPVTLLFWAKTRVNMPTINCLILSSPHKGNVSFFHNCSFQFSPWNHWEKWSKNWLESYMGLFLLNLHIWFIFVH